MFEETKIISGEELKKLFKSMIDKPKQKGLVLLPSPNGFNVYQLDAETLRNAIKITKFLKKYPPFEYKPIELEKTNDEKECL